LGCTNADRAWEEAACMQSCRLEIRGKQQLSYSHLDNKWVTFGVAREGATTRAV